MTDASLFHGQTTSRTTGRPLPMSWPQLPRGPEVEEIPMRETDFATLYGVRLSSIGPYRLYGYLSIPKGTGTVPRDLLGAEVPERTRDHPAGNGERHEEQVRDVLARGEGAT